MTTLSSLLTNKTRLTWVNQTSNYTMNNRQGVFCNTSPSSGFILSFPPSPRLGDSVALMDATNTFNTFNLTISGNGNNINGSSSTVLLSGYNQALTMVYSGSTLGWITKSYYEDSPRLFPRGYISGLSTSTNSVTANTALNISGGECKCDMNECNITLKNTIVKRLDANWSVGTNNGGLDTGAKANSTWYHVYVIRKSSDSSVDAIFSTNAVKPALPSGYKGYRRIASIQTNSSGNIRGYAQVMGNIFLWSTPILDVSGRAPTTTAANSTITIPLGIKTIPLVSHGSTAVASVLSHALYSPDITDQAISVNTGFWTSSRATGCWSCTDTLGNNLRSNTASQVRYVESVGSTGTVMQIGTYGYIDIRGKDA